MQHVPPSLLLIDVWFWFLSLIMCSGLSAVSLVIVPADSTAP